LRNNESPCSSFSLTFCSILQLAVLPSAINFPNGNKKKVRDINNTDSIDTNNDQLEMRRMNQQDQKIKTNQHKQKQNKMRASAPELSFSAEAALAPPPSTSTSTISLKQYQVRLSQN